MTIRHHLFLLAMIMATGLCAHAQSFDRLRLHLKNADYKPEQITQAQLRDFNRNSAIIDGQSFAILQFDEIPTKQRRAALAGMNITLIGFLSSNAYTVSLRSSPSLAVLKRMKVRAILPVTASLKMNPRLVTLNQSGDLKLSILCFSTVAMDTIMLALRRHGFDVIDRQFINDHIISLSVPMGRVMELAALPFVSYIEPTPDAPRPLNFESRNGSRANILHSTLPGGYNLTGEGVLVGVVEPGALPFNHIDYRSRVIAGPIGPTGTFHASHVFGIVSGDGSSYERYKGYAPKVKVISSSNPFANNSSAGLYSLVNDSHLVLSNNSYAVGAWCSTDYSFFTAPYDKVSIDMPTFIEVWGAGNEGNVICNQILDLNPYSSGWNTVASLANSAKNTISVANTYHNGIIHPTSSRGPGPGGLLKPDIAAIGSDVISTDNNQGYKYGTGTSMSAPAVVGGLALLNQRYRQLHNEQLPEQALMKNIICNTATDLGNRGPDFTYGYGWMNLLRAIRTLESNSYFKDSVNDQQEKTFTIQVPAGIAQLKAMLYWHDPITGGLSARPLVNDLDLKVGSPAGTIILPYAPDPTPGNEDMPAPRAEDHRNNMEQVVIDKPVPGTYTISVKGFSVGMFDSQAFWISYDMVPDRVELTFPSAGEPLLPGEPLYIQWDDAQTNTSRYTIEYSADGGNNWQVVNDNIDAAARLYQWSVPSSPTANGKVRIRRNANGIDSESATFIVLGTPFFNLSAVQCPGYFNIDWSAIPGATKYEIYLFGSERLRSIGFTTETHYSIGGLSTDSLYFVSVRPWINDKPGVRGVSRAKIPTDGNCEGAIADGDLQASITSTALVGRTLTSSALGADQKITVKIHNLDDQPSGSLSLHANVNGVGWTSEDFPGPIGGSGDFMHTFQQGYDFSAANDYIVNVAVSAAADMNKTNDSASVVVRSLPNEPVNISMPFIDSFEESQPRQYGGSIMGIQGAARYDYVADAGNGALTVGQAGVMSSDRKELMMFSTVSSVSTAHQRLIGTFNMAAYDTGIVNVGLQLTYSRNGQLSGHEKLYVRGSDTDPWTEVYVFQSLIGVINNQMLAWNISSTLKKAHQNFSSSFQLSIDQVVTPARFSISRVMLYDIGNDAEVLSIDTIPAKSCDLGNGVPIKMRLRNNGMQALVNLHLRYSIDGTQEADEVLTSIAAGASASYSFSTLANMSSFGYHKVRVWIDNPGETYPANNSREFTVRNEPSINSFPYLEDFEKGDGNWYAEGTNSSWEPGSPSSSKIRQAASGSRAWKTKLGGNYNTNELSYLYSPCFDLSTLTSPQLSFSLVHNLDFCYSNAVCDGLTMQYSTNGTMWIPMVLSGQNTYNWESTWGADRTVRWKVTTDRLPVVPRILFRFQMKSDDYINLDGVAIDDIHIYDSAGSIYNGPTLTSPITKNITAGNQWVDYRQDGDLVASVRANGQTLGATEVMCYNDNGIPNFQGQYYLGHHFRINTANSPTDSIDIRLYFRDSEIDSMAYSSACATCVQPPDAYRIGVSTYHTNTGSEYDALLQNNLSGVWGYLNTTKVRTVPYQEGYYIEFRVKDGSEYWLNSGGLDKNSALPMQFSDMIASRSGSSEASIGWTTLSEINIDHFEIEAALGNESYTLGNYVSVGTVKSLGRSLQPQHYSFADVTRGKEGVYYYRVKAIDPYGNYSYSNVIPVIWSDDWTWQVFPNPSADGRFTISYQGAAGEQIKLRLFGALGSLIREMELPANGFIQQATVDIGKNMPAGVYLLRVQTQRGESSMRLIKR